MTSQTLNQHLRPITKADVLAFKGKPFNCSVKGFVVVSDDEIVAMAGVMYSIPMQAFSTITDEGRKFPKLFIHGARRFRELLSEFDLPIIAFANPLINSSEKYLEYIGFEYIGDNAEHGRIYKWLTP